MKRLWMVFAMLLMASASFAQLGGGTLSGTVTDEQGGALPGVAVTVAGTDRTATVVTDEAGRFRLLNLAPGTYKVTLALQGFTTIVREKVVVAVGATVDLPIAMKVGGVAETVTVSGASPIVDTKATGTATNFTADELQKIPTSRDPFALMRRCRACSSTGSTSAATRPASSRTSRRRARARRMRAGRSTASRSPTWRPRAPRRRTSTTTTSTRSRSRPRATTSSRAPAASA